MTQKSCNCAQQINDTHIGAGNYDSEEYEKYACVLSTGELSIDALSRIIRHDKSSGSNDTKALARVAVLKDARDGMIPHAKEQDECGDALYGVAWPTPLTFTECVVVPGNK